MRRYGACLRSQRKSTLMILKESIGSIVWRSMAPEAIHLYFSEFEKQLRFVGFIVLGLLSDSTSM